MWFTATAFRPREVPVTAEDALAAVDAIARLRINWRRFIFPCSKSLSSFAIKLSIGIFLLLLKKPRLEDQTGLMILFELAGVTSAGQTAGWPAYPHRRVWQGPLRGDGRSRTGRGHRFCSPLP